MKQVFLFCLLLIATNVFSQEGSIKGKILDVEMNNEPLLFANIQIKDTNYVAQTNFHGNFEIANLTTGDYTLVISYPGYETIEMLVTVENGIETKINNGLKAKTINMQDVSMLHELDNSIEVTTNTQKRVSK